MRIATEIRRPLGTMIVYGFARGDLAVDLDIAARIGAEVVEVLPDWKSYPDPVFIRNCVADHGLAIHSAHGCWGGRSIRASRVDLASTDPATQAASLDDLRRCVDWLEAAGGTCLVVHPGVLSLVEDSAQRGEALTGGLLALADYARGTGVTLCVENMPPGVHPGSRMEELFAIVDRVDRPEVAPGARHRPRPHLGRRIVRDPRGRPAPPDHPRPRQRRPKGCPPPARPGLDRLGRLAPLPRRDRLPGADPPGVHPPPPRGSGEPRRGLAGPVATFDGDGTMIPPDPTV